MQSCGSTGTTRTNTPQTQEVNDAARKGKGAFHFTDDESLDRDRAVLISTVYSKTAKLTKGQERHPEKPKRKNNNKQTKCCLAGRLLCKADLSDSVVASGKV